MTKSRKVRIQETREAKPDLALAYLEDLFNHASTREKVLALDPGRLKQLHTVLGNWKVQQWITFTHSITWCFIFSSILFVLTVGAVRSPQLDHRGPSASQNRDGTESLYIPRSPRCTSATQRKPPRLVCISVSPYSSRFVPKSFPSIRFCISKVASFINEALL